MMGPKRKGTTAKATKTKGIRKVINHNALSRIAVDGRTRTGRDPLR